MGQSDQPLGLALSEGLGPLPEPVAWSWRDINGDQQVNWWSKPEDGRELFAAHQLRAYAAAAVAVERQRIAALIAQHSGLTLETLEYLETMRQGPSPQEWAELDRAARA